MNLRKTLMASMATLVFSAAAAVAEKTSVLVEEEVQNQYGYELPDRAIIDIRLLNSEDNEAIHIPDFWFDKVSGQFKARVILEDGNAATIAGVAILNVEIPVPVRRIMPDEIIEAGDVEMIPLPYARLSSFTVMQSQDIVGMQVKRTLAKGRPVVTQSINPPLVIRRGDKVKISYRKGKMHLSAPGKALSDAFSGQELKVVNLVSHNTVVAIASHEGSVEVMN